MIIMKPKLIALLGSIALLTPSAWSTDEFADDGNSKTTLDISTLSQAHATVEVSNRSIIC